MKRLILLFAMFSMFALGGCSDNCDDEMDRIKSQYGPPSYTEQITIDGTHGVGYVYAQLGIMYVFVWGNDVDGCETSTYHVNKFSELTDENKAKAWDEKVLVGRERSSDCGPVGP